MNPTNVTLDAYPHGRSCLQWHYNGWRYHIWTDVNDPELKPDENKLYKNPIDPPRYGNHTLTLRANAITNAAVIDKVRAIVAEHDMVNKAVAAIKAEREAEEAKYRAGQLREIEDELAVTYFSVLEHLVRELAPDHGVVGNITNMRTTLRQKANLPV